MQTIRFGIIGGGLMGREFASAAARWCHLLDAPARPVLVAVCDLQPAIREWFSGHVPDVRQTTADYRELLDNPDVDAVYIAVPHNLHAQLYVECLQAGKHLLGEKPFGIDLPANARILDAVRRHPHLVVRASSEFPFFPAVQRIVTAVREERFGKILEVEAGFLHSSDMDPDKPINWKRTLAANGEYGCMGDLGLHVFHLPLRFGWIPSNIRAVLSSVVPERPDASGRLVPCETWDNATILCEVRTRDQAFPLTAKTQRMAPGETDTWYLSVKGTRFSARFTTRYPRTLETMPYEKGKPQAWLDEAVGYESVYKTITGSILEFGFSDAILQMIAAFCHQIQAGPDAQLPFGCATPDETRLTHAIFTAALLSHKESKVVPVR